MPSQSHHQSSFRIEVTILVDPALRQMHNEAGENTAGAFMSTEYVQAEGDVYRIVGSRVSLDSIIYASGMVKRPKRSHSHFRS